MARYTVTLVFDVVPGAAPPGTDPLAAVPLPEGAVHRSSSCDGAALTVVVDFRSSHPAAVCHAVADAVRTAWAGISGTDPGEPRRARVRPLRLPQPSAGGLQRPREYVWRPDAAGNGDGALVLVDAGSEPYSRPNAPAEPHVAAHTPARRTRGLGPLRLALPMLPRRHHDST